MTTIVAKFGAIPFLVLLLGTAPADQVIPLPGGYGEAIIVPAGSPVRLARFNKEGSEYVGARFDGRFVVEGTFVLDCNYCEPGENDNQLSLNLVPDAAISSRLPHWKVHNNQIAIDVMGADSFIRTISTADERRRLLSGELDEIRGRTTLVLDHFEAGLDCDSADYSARFVAVARAPIRKKLELAGDFGCGGI
jgi:hypothetical protein